MSNNEKMNRDLIQQQIQNIKKRLTGDMMNDMPLRDEIHKLEMKLNGTKPPDSNFECEGCGS